MLVTERLMLRPWWDDDFERMAAILGDGEVMHWLGRGPMTRAESDRYVARMVARAMADGFGPWAVEAPRVAPLVGVVGLRRVADGLPCAPCVELVWKIGRPWWGRGYATEAARAAVADLFETRDIAEVVACTAEGNAASRRVMEKLDMTRAPGEDFDHPLLAAGHPLRRHVLYRLARPSRPIGAAGSGWRLAASFADGGTVPDR